jgi:hypothetical protein
MTALATRPLATPRLPGLVWVTWRQHRAALAGVAALLGGLSLGLFFMGLAMHHDYVSLKVAQCLHSPSCELPYSTFKDRWGNWAMLLPQYLLIVAGLIGVFVGGPLVSREYESGTFRFAWTQGTSRVRWITAKLALLATLLLLLSLAFSWVFTWWYGPWNGLNGRVGPGGAYETEGVVFAARVVYGFTLAALVGAVLKRPIAAMVTAGLLWITTVFVDVVWLRRLIATPLTVPDTTFQHTTGGWQLSTWTRDPSGHQVSQSTVNALAKAAGATGNQVPVWLRRQGYTFWDSYQPESRFWHFQLVEGAGYLVIALLLAAVTVWLLRRRAA